MAAAVLLLAFLGAASCGKEEYVHTGPVAVDWDTSGPLPPRAQLLYDATVAASIADVRVKEAGIEGFYTTAISCSATIRGVWLFPDKTHVVIAQVGHRGGTSYLDGGWRVEGEDLLLTYPDSDDPEPARYWMRPGAIQIRPMRLDGMDEDAFPNPKPDPDCWQYKRPLPKTRKNQVYPLVLRK